MVCTIAMARRSAPSSLDSAITWIIDPGLAPISADSGSQRCTTRRYVMVATIMTIEATIRIATLAGIGGEAFERLRRHHGAEQDADDDVADTGQPDRYLDRTPQQCGCGYREHRSGHEAGGKT